MYSFSETLYIDLYQKLSSRSVTGTLRFIKALFMESEEKKKAYEKKRDRGIEIETGKEMDTGREMEKVRDRCDSKKENLKDRIK